VCRSWRRLYVVAHSAHRTSSYNFPAMNERQENIHYDIATRTTRPVAFPVGVEGSSIRGSSGGFNVYHFVSLRRDIHFKAVAVVALTKVKDR
jgi:hypothetical protein